MQNRYTCFVISPIGKPTSEVRLAADDTFEYIIKPALDKFDIIVERADHIRGITDTITKEMVERIQRSDLCVVDLTGLNPNVMYECGRRHETGKPCILISRDEHLPFDVVTHPVIRYSLDGTAKDAINTIRIIQQNVQQYIDLGFEHAGNRTISDVLRELGVVAQKVDLVLKRVASNANLATTDMSSADKAKEASALIKKLGGIVPAINYAMTQRDAELLDHLLPRVPNKKGENFLLGGLVQGAAIGSRVAFQMLEEVLSTGIDGIGWDVRSKMLGAYSAGASSLDEENRALPVVKSAVESMRKHLEEGGTIDATDQTTVLNALQRTHHGLQQYEEAIRVGAEVIALEPTEPSYHYNQALNLHGAGRTSDALDCVDNLVSLLRDRDFTDSDDDHLTLSIRLYIEAGRVNEARELFVHLQDQYPLQAEILLSSDDVAALFE